jgi:hypothetical protein
MPCTALLAELYVAARDFRRAVDVTAALSNADDLSVYALMMRAHALAEVGEYHAALAVLTTALSTKKREVRLLMAARELRASIYDVLEELTKARKERAVVTAAVGRGEDIGATPRAGPTQAVDGAADISTETPSFFTSRTEPERRHE